MLPDAQNLKGSAGLEPAANAVKHYSPLTAGGLVEVSDDFLATVTKRFAASCSSLHANTSANPRSLAGTE